MKVNSSPIGHAPAEGKRVDSPKLRRAGRLALTRIGRWPHDVALGDLLAAATVAFNVVLIASTFILIHYFNIDALTSLFYVGQEQCAPGSGMLGSHCFGDYNLGSVLSLPNPWDYVTQVGPWNYPAASMAPSAIFLWFGTVIGHQKIATLLYVVLMAVGFAIPAAWASRGRRLWVRIAITAMFGFLSVPALMAIDRGNVVGLAVPFIFLAMVSVAKHRFLLAAIAIALAAGAKPQYGLAILIFVFLGRWLWLLVCAAIAAVVQFLPFLLWPQAFPGSIVQAFTGMFSFGSQSTLGNTIPVSVSFTNGAYLLEEWFVRPLRGIDSTSWVEGHQGLITAVLVGGLVIVVFLARRALPSALVAGLLFMIASLAVPTTFTYYFIAALPIAAIVLRNPEAHYEPDDRFRGVLELGSTKRWVEFAAAGFLAITVAATISRSFIPRLIPDMPYFIFTDAAFVTVMWLFAIPLYGIVKMVVRRSDARVLRNGAGHA